MNKNMKSKDKFKALALVIVLFTVMYITFTILFATTDISYDLFWVRLFMATNYFVTALLTFAISYKILKDVYLTLFGVLLIGVIIINLVRMIATDFSFAHTALLVAFTYVIIMAEKKED